MRGYKPLSRTWLASLATDSKVYLKLRVAFDGVNDENLATVFPDAEYTIISALTIVATQLNLNGIAVKFLPWTSNGQDYLNNTATRTATGGSPPYTYQSSNTAAVSVHLTTGKVIGNRNGTSEITVTDNNGNTASYITVVSNVFTLLQNLENLTATQAIAWRKTDPSAIAVENAHFLAMERIYGVPRLPIIGFRWPTIEAFQGNQGLAYDAAQGLYYRGIGDRANGWALKPY